MLFRSAPARGNTVLITHNPNLARVFPEFGNAMAQGEAAVMRPDGKGGAALVTRLTIEQWATLAR